MTLVFSEKQNPAPISPVEPGIASSIPATVIRTKGKTIIIGKNKIIENPNKI